MRRAGGLARSARRQRGQAMVEFALILPMLLILIFGILEFAFIMTDQIELNNAVREGARAGAVHIDGNTQSGITTDAYNHADSSSGALISCTPKNVSVPPPQNYPNYSAPGPAEVTVTIICIYTPVTPLGKLVSGVMSKPVKFSASATKMIEP